MPAYFARPKAWFMTFRIMAVVVWSVMTVTVSTAYAALETGQLDWVNFILALLTASLVQGFPAHIVNEITDWQSGADRLVVPGKKTGGAKVLRTGLASIPQLWHMFWITTALVMIPVVWLTLRTNLFTMVLFLLGYLICIFYTLPPVRFAYRPFAGEWLGGFPGVALNVVGAYYVQTLTFDTTIVWLAAGTGLMYVAVMVLFHYLDHESDVRAIPPKRTTIVFLGLRRSKGYVLTVVAAAIAVLVVLTAGAWIFSILAAGAVLQLYFHWRCDTGSDTSLVLTGKQVTYVLMASSIIFSALIRVEFLIVIAVVLLSFYFHRRFGKLPAHPNDLKPL